MNFEKYYFIFKISQWQLKKRWHNCKGLPSRRSRKKPSGPLLSPILSHTVSSKYPLSVQIKLSKFRPRFGLFSQPVSNAIGETNKFVEKKRVVDEDGKVVIGPRNFYTKKMQRGKTDKVYFGQTDQEGQRVPQSYNCIGDPFKQNKPSGMRSIAPEEERKAKGGHDHNFKPAK